MIGLLRAVRGTSLGAPAAPRWRWPRTGRRDSRYEPGTSTPACRATAMTTKPQRGRGVDASGGDPTPTSTTGEGALDRTGAAGAADSGATTEQRLEQTERRLDQLHAELADLWQDARDLDERLERLAPGELTSEPAKDPPEQVGDAGDPSRGRARSVAPAGRQRPGKGRVRVWFAATAMAVVAAIVVVAASGIRWTGAGAGEAFCRGAPRQLRGGASGDVLDICAGGEARAATLAGRAPCLRADVRIADRQAAPLEDPGRPGGRVDRR